MIPRSIISKTLETVPFRGRRGGSGIDDIVVGLCASGASGDGWLSGGVGFESVFMVVLSLARETGIRNADGLDTSFLTRPSTSIRQGVK